MFKPRKMQSYALDKCIEVLTDTKIRREAAYLPCSFGKSWLIAMIVEKLPKGSKILVLQPNIEILIQNVSKIKALGIPISIYSASAGEKDLTENVIYATPKSLSYEILKEANIKYVIVDESDFGSRPNSEMIKMLKKLKIKSALGITGSPLYLENTNEGSVTSVMTRVKGAFFTKICCTINISEMVANKYWSDIKYYDVFDHSKQDILKLDSSGAEYTEQSQKSFYVACNLKEKVSTFLKRLPKGEDALVFVPNISSAEELQQLIPNSAVVHSKTNKKLRKTYIEQFANGEITTLINVGSLLAGYDKPSLKNLVDCSASNSIRVKIQKDGRIVRISEGKEFGRIIDFVGNFRRLGDVRDLEFCDVPNYGFGLFGKDNRLLTDVPMNSKEIITKEYLEKFGKPNNSYIFGEENKGDAVLGFGKHKGSDVKKLYLRQRHYLKWLAESDMNFTDKELEYQIKSIWDKDFKKVEETSPKPQIKTIQNGKQIIEDFTSRYNINNLNELF